MSHSTTSPSQDQLVREWLASQDDVDPDLPEVLNVEETDEGVVILLNHDLDLEYFAEAVDGYPLEDPQFEDAHLEVEYVEDAEYGEAIRVYEVKDLGNGSEGRFKVGSTYVPTDQLVLSGDGKPMWPDGDPVDAVVEQTLLHLSLYLRY